MQKQRAKNQYVEIPCSCCGMIAVKNRHYIFANEHNFYNRDHQARWISNGRKFKSMNEKELTEPRYLVKKTTREEQWNRYQLPIKQSSNN